MVEDNNSETEKVFVPQGSEQETKPAEKKSFIDVLKMFAPGTSIRSALDDLLRAGMGALIVLDNGNVFKVVEKGFRIYSKFTAQKLVELAKMDGAIILSRNLKKIICANAFLFPEQDIPTRETGMRHKAAERTSKQTGAIVLALSERKKKISLYYGGENYILKESSEVLRRAAETLQILEKQRESFDEALNNLNLLELSRMVTIIDVCKVIQRFETIKRISGQVKRYLVELGKEGIIVSMRLKDLIRGLDDEEELLLKDYFWESYSYVKKLLRKMDFDFLLEPLNLSRVLFEEIHDKKISPRGLRILSKTNILERYVNSLVAKFKSFDRILSAKDEELMGIFQNEGLLSFFKEELYSLREKINLGKII